MVFVPYMSINPSKKREVQVVLASRDKVASIKKNCKGKIV